MKRAGLITLAALAAFATGAEAAQTPVIRTSASNKVPACVTPERMTAFLRKRNPKLDERFNEVGADYKQHGQELGVRWDYAFFQMIVETNWLTYKTGSGRWGDVRPSQNNFAGIGATGGGVRGEAFPDVSTGVEAHLDHIRLYSGDPVSEPKAKRTKLVADEILPWAQGLGHDVTFTDLTKQWSPGDNGYSDDIETIAKAYRDLYCSKTEEAAAEPSEPAAEPAKTVTASAETGSDSDAAGKAEETTASSASDSDAASTGAETETNAAKTAANDAAETATPSSDTASTGTDAAATTGDDTSTASAGTIDTAATATTVALQAPKLNAAGGCKVFTASYGGAKSLLIQSQEGELTRYTALAVHSGKETAQAAAFIKAYAQGGRAIGSYASQDEALTKAFQLCPES